MSTFRHQALNVIVHLQTSNKSTPPCSTMLPQNYSRNSGQTLKYIWFRKRASWSKIKRSDSFARYFDPDNKLWQVHKRIKEATPQMHRSIRLRSNGNRSMRFKNENYRSVPQYDRHAVWVHTWMYSAYSYIYELNWYSSRAVNVALSKKIGFVLSLLNLIIDHSHL